MGVLSNLCLWTISHLLYAPEPKITQKQQLPPHSWSLHLWTCPPPSCLSLFQTHSEKEELWYLPFKFSSFKNITFIVIIWSLFLRLLTRHMRRGERAGGKEDSEKKGGSESNPTISPRVARFQLTTAWFISFHRVIAIFNHFLSPTRSISSSHSYHLTPPPRAVSLRSPSLLGASSVSSCLSLRWRCVQH